MSAARWLCRSLLALLLGAVSAPLVAQEPAPELTPVDKQQIEAALKLTTAEAGKYTLQLDGADTQAKLREESLLRWSNPSVGEIHGNVFLWTVNERPAAIGSLYKWFTPHTHMSHEFHSLSESPLAARYDDKEVWRTKKPGVSFVAVPEAPAPAATAAQRLLQMKRIARDFTATKTERDGSRQEMRLLPQPIYRYAAPAEEVQDGGLFVLVQGTDPEVFLLLEARGKADAQPADRIDAQPADRIDAQPADRITAPRWMFAPARMNSVGFDVRYQDKPIWNVEIMPSRDISSHAEAYTRFMFTMP
jgi:hypothetical protein